MLLSTNSLINVISLFVLTDFSFGYGLYFWVQKSFKSSSNLAPLLRQAIYFWVDYSMPCAPGGVSTLAGGNSNFIRLYSLLLVMFLASVGSLHTCNVNQRFQKNLAYFYSTHTPSLFLSLRLSPLWYSVSLCYELYMPWTPQALNSVPFNSRNCWVLFKFLFSGLWPGNSLGRMVRQLWVLFLFS